MAARESRCRGGRGAFFLASARSAGSEQGFRDSSFVVRTCNCKSLALCRPLDCAGIEWQADGGPRQVCARDGVRMQQRVNSEWWLLKTSRSQLQDGPFVVPPSSSSKSQRCGSLRASFSSRHDFLLPGTLPREIGGCTESFPAPAD